MNEHRVNTENQKGVKKKMPPSRDRTMLKINSREFLLAMAKLELEPKELAEKAGVSANVVYKARRGCYVKPKYIGKIAKALNMEVAVITEPNSTDV
ncbi:MAG: helix-turn-helix domain-containing protein [Lachnospiraceae bacterium]|nr:helix-turn-helix domain-containing protein [Lachnospiraceae bacterium]